MLSNYELSMLEQTRRSLAMLQSNCLAMHRDEAINLIEKLQRADSENREMQDELERLRGR